MVTDFITITDYRLSRRTEQHSASMTATVQQDTETVSACLPTGTTKHNT